MKLSAWAKKNGLDYKTAYRLFRSGKFPYPTEQLPTGTILVHELPTPTKNAVLYAYVSSMNQKTDLSRQLQRLRDFASAKGITVQEEVTEMGLGLNGHRNKLIKILLNPSISIIIVEHRDRLARFGAEYIIASLSASHRQIIIANNTECKDDMVQDMINVLTSLCVKLYGRKSAKNKVKKAMEIIQNEH